MAFCSFRKEAVTVDEAGRLPACMASFPRMGSRAQTAMLVMLVAIGSGGFAVVGYASARSMARDEIIEEMQPPAPVSKIAPRLPMPTSSA